MLEREREAPTERGRMREISSVGGFRLLAFFSSILLLFVSAYSDDISTPKNGTNTEHHSGSKGSKVLIGLTFVGAAMLSFFLFKLWQRKKREEQYARLLRLFEEDDELELELGLRD